MKKIDVAIVVEIVGIALVATGLAFVFLPAALVVTGSFLIWLTEKAN